MKTSPAWLEARAAVHVTDDRVLRVDGAGARSWLNSLLTIDLRSATPEAARYALLLTPTGGIVSDAWVVECGTCDRERLALVLPKSRSEVVHRSLEKYLLNEDVALAFDDDVVVIALAGVDRLAVVPAGPKARNIYASARLGAGGSDLWVDRSESARTTEELTLAALRCGGGLVDPESWNAARVQLAVPMAGVDFDEELTPHEAGLDRRAVSLSKGCYLGQERVARQQRRGELGRRLVQLEVEGGAVSTPALPARARVFTPAAEPVGSVTSVGAAIAPGASRVLALGQVNPAHAVADEALSVEGRSARVRVVLGSAEPGATRAAG
jgi:folate-binding protein YgfZ